MPTEVPPRTTLLFPRLRHSIAMVWTRVRTGAALPGPVRADVPPPELSRWSTAWRYLLASALGLVVLLVVSAELIPQERFEDVPEDVAVAVSAILFLDVLLGVLALLLLPLRRRRPVLTVAVTAALTGLSASAFPAAAFAAVSLGTRRRPAGVLGVGAVWVGAALVYELAYRPSFSAVPIEESVPILALWALVLIAYSVCVAIGTYVRARRELVASLRQRAVTAELEQELRSTAAREAERTGIAREMHDVLAHRISLVALHAGALTYRDDLTAEQVATTAGVVQDNAHLALTELRQVLGVLRSGTPDPAEPPQPTLAELPALLADAAEAGTDIHVDTTGLADAGGSSGRGLSETVSRTAFRIVQESLTNARKHAPGVPVSLQLAGGPDSTLAVEVRNAVLDPGPGVGPPGAGVGLVGLAERAELAGGGLQFATEDGTFVVRAWLPWR